MNRHKVKKYFITFPKSTLTRSEFYVILSEEYSTDILYFKCVQESHKDGTPHLHLIVIFRVGVSKPNMLKFFKRKLPNDNKRIKVEVLRSLKHALVYLDKEDKNPLVVGIVPTSDRLKKMYIELYKRLSNMVDGCPCEYFRMEINCPVCGCESDMNKVLKKF